MWSADNGIAYAYDYRQAGSPASQISTGYNMLGIDASRSSSIYGNSTTVQPNSVEMCVCIKY